MLFDNVYNNLLSLPSTIIYEKAAKRKEKCNVIVI